MSEHDKEEELRRVWCELALAWKLYDAAVREHRYVDALTIAAQREHVEARARELLHMPRRT